MSELKSLPLILIALCLLASACSPAKPSAPVTLTVSATSQMPKPSPSLTATQPPTDIPATATFNPHTIITVTPAPAAKCPQTTHAINPDIGFLEAYGDEPEIMEKNIQDFLNHFGVVALQKAVQQSSLKRKNNIYFQDVTNDGLPDVIIGYILKIDIIFKM